MLEAGDSDDASERSPLLGTPPTSSLASLDASVSGSFNLPVSVESPDQFRSRWLSIRIMYLTMFLSAVTFTITMSTIWPYLQVVDNEATPSLLGWVVAAYSLGQLMASPLFGAWSTRRRSAREPLVVSLLLQVAANFFYAYVPSMSGNGGLYLAIARTLMGFASGNAAVVRAYVSGATNLGERTSAMANVSIFQSVGFILGPVVQTILVFVGYPGPVERSWLHLNLYTTPAFLAALLALVNLALLVTIFREHTVQDRSRLNINQDDDVAHVTETPVNNSDETGVPDYVAVFTTMYLFFIIFFIFTIFETIGTPLGMDMYGWSKPEAALYMGIMLATAGILAIAVFIVVKVLSKRFDDRMLLVAGYTLCLVGFFIYLPWGSELPVRGYAPVYTPVTLKTTTPIPHVKNSHDSARTRTLFAGTLGHKYEQIFPQDAVAVSNYTADGIEGIVRLASMHVTTPNSTNATVAPEGCPWNFGWCGNVPRVLLAQFIVGTAFVAMGYPVCNVMTYTLFSKVLGPQPQGLWMGFLTATGSLARTLGPIFVSQVYDAYGPRVTFASSCGVIILTLCCCAAAYRRLLPFATTPFRHHANSND